MGRERGGSTSGVAAAGAVAGAAAMNKLVDFGLLPDYLRDNEYIVGHYRANLTLRQTLLSIFQIHNETVNIWTHLIGFFLFMALTSDALLEKEATTHPTSSSSYSSSPSSLSSPATRFPFLIFMAGAMFCLLSSSLCHLMACHSRRLSYLLWRLDYAGIATMIATSFFPPVYYMFMCHPFWKDFYLTGITLIGVTTVTFSLLPNFHTPTYRNMRAAIFLCMGCSGIIPASHALVTHWEEPACLESLALELVMGFLYATGTLFYATRIPERWWPGLFDLAGHSHQIFHIFVILGAYSHYKAGLLYLQWRDSKAC